MTGIDPKNRMGTDDRAADLRAEAARRARRRPAVPASVGGAVADDRSEDGVGVARSSEEVTAARRSHSGTALRGDIEGLRAIAVGTVLLYHLGLPWLPGGFVGVDVFFVISGFLITSLLLRESTKTGTVSISDFYARRARRLLPAASTVLLPMRAEPVHLGRYWSLVRDEPKAVRRHVCAPKKRWEIRPSSSRAKFMP